jgi:hypothetical protein
MSTGKIAAVIVGAILGMVAIGLIIGGGFLIWANETQRDADDFFTTDEVVLSTESYALTSEEVDLGSRPGEWFPSGRLATVRIAVGGTAPVFVGIGPEDDVDAYFEDVAHSQVANIGIDGGDINYRNVTGDGTPAPPGEQDFWAVSAAGADTQTIEWDLEQGSWTVVVMNEDGSAGVTVDAAAGARTDLLIWFAIGLLAAGLILGVIGAVVIVVAVVSRSGEPAPAAAAVGPGYGPYPVLVEGHIDSDLSRWQWLVKWLLAIPHFVVLAFLWMAFFLLTVVAFFAILFTGGSASTPPAWRRPTSTRRSAWPTSTTRPGSTWPTPSSCPGVWSW